MPKRGVLPLKIAYVFPGQGAQYPGMAKEIYDQFASARQVFKTASRTLGYSMERLCFEEGDRLNLTEYTQPALVTASCAVLAAMHESLNLSADTAAGLSLGEYSALVCAGAVDFADAVMLVSKRGRFMQEACPAGAGTMATVLGLDRDCVIDICLDIQKAGAGIVEPANFNCPGQIVISGETAAVERAAELAQSRGARRVIRLNVSGPFHSSLLSAAGTRLRSELAQVDITSPTIPVYSNVAARPSMDPDEIRELLVRQVASPVLWEQTVANMAEAGIDVFIEVGPGRTLTGLVKKTVPHAVAMNVGDLSSLEALREFLAEHASVHLPSQVAQVAAAALKTEPASLRKVSYATQPELVSSSKRAYR